MARDFCGHTYPRFLHPLQRENPLFAPSCVPLLRSPAPRQDLRGGGQADRQSSCRAPPLLAERLQGELHEQAAPRAESLQHPKLRWSSLARARTAEEGSNFLKGMPAPPHAATCAISSSARLFRSARPSTGAGETDPASVGGCPCSYIIRVEGVHMSLCKR